MINGTPIKLKPSSDHLVLYFFPKMSMVTQLNQGKVCIDQKYARRSGRIARNTRILKGLKLIGEKLLTFSNTNLAVFSHDGKWLNLQN